MSSVAGNSAESKMQIRRRKVSVSLHDVRWQTGAVEELSARISAEKDSADDQQASNEETPKVYEEFDPFEGLEDGHKCTTCECSIEVDDREAIIGHYRSQWHRFNSRRVLRGRQPLTELEFEELGEEERVAGEEPSSSDSDDADSDDVALKLGPSHVYFVHNEEVFSIYRCLLNHGESTVTASVFARPLDCAIFLLAGGHFAGGVFKNDKMVVKKSFHRYVVRAKQGGAQSANDKSKGIAHSAGATLRRYNERALREDIVNVLQTWSEHLKETPLIFIRCASFQRVIFHDIEEGGFDRKDPRLRTIPFETKRPLVDEVRRVWDRLASVTSHGSMEEFLAEKTKRKQRMKTLLKKKRVEEHWDPTERPEKERSPAKEKKTYHLKPAPVISEHHVEVDKWPSLDKNRRRELYTMVKENRDDLLHALVDNSNEDVRKEICGYLNCYRFTTDGGTFLHLAAKSGADRVLQNLLEFGCDPSVKDDNDLVAYAVSADKSTKQVFVQFRSEHPEMWSWTRCHVPEPTQLTEEQLAKINEKKREKKQRQKEKLKLKKEAEKKEADELAARAAFLAMSDREKRAAAAEARLARLDGGPRCVQCGVAYAGSGFEYMELKFCSPSCVSLHRRGTAPREQM